MMVCLCHPFSDKKVRKHLESTEGRACISATYSACSGGERPSCCTCLETLKTLVKTHNERVTTV